LIKPKSTDFDRIQGVFSSRRDLEEFIYNLTPLTDERCNYNAMIEYITIRKLKG
jgi:hypothetical protein